MNIEQTSIRNSTTVMTKEKADDRAELLAAHTALVEEEGPGIAWIAKLSSGAKGLWYIIDERPSFIINTAPWKRNYHQI